MMWLNWWRVSPTKAVQMADRACRRLEESRVKLRRDLKDLFRVQEKAAILTKKVELISETLREDVEDCDKRIAYAEKALEAVRSEYEIAANVEIPRLTSALMRFQASDEADIALSNSRRAGATPIPFEDK